MDIYYGASAETSKQTSVIILTYTHLLSCYPPSSSTVISYCFLSVKHSLYSDKVSECVSLFPSRSCTNPRQEGRFHRHHDEAPRLSSLPQCSHSYLPPPLVTHSYLLCIPSYRKFFVALLIHCPFCFSEEQRQNGPKSSNSRPVIVTTKLCSQRVSLCL